MHQYKKILVIGNCGSGKSIFSRKLARKLDIPLIHLDREFWKPGWITTPEDEWQEKVKQLVAHDQWIIDGNYFKSMPLRMQAADWIIFLDTNPWRCLYRILKRTFLGKNRPDMPTDYADKFSFSFCWFVLHYNRTLKHKITALLQQHQATKKITVLKTNDVITFDFKQIPLKN